MSLTRPRRLLLVGGSAGTGKSTVADWLAQELGAGWLQLDTVWIALRAAAGPGSAAYRELDVAGRLHRGEESDDELLAAHVEAAKAVCRVLPDVFAFELDTHQALVADGAWLLPDVVAGLDLPDIDVRTCFLQHATVNGMAAALTPRLGGRAPEERHRRMNRQIWQYGDWLAGEARRHGLPVLDPLPFDTLTDRVAETLRVPAR